MVYEKKDHRKRRTITIRADYELFDKLKFVANFRNQNLSETLRYLANYAADHHIYHLQQIGIKIKEQLTEVQPESEKQTI